MQVDYSVELGKDDPALELPWRSEDGVVHYFDLKSDAKLISQVPEAAGSPELAEFLVRINAPGFPLQTAKCDVWQSHDLSPEEEIFDAECKFGSYVDLIFAEQENLGSTESRNSVALAGDESSAASRESDIAENPRHSFEAHESLAKRLCTLLARVPEMPASAEFVVRRCYYHTVSNNETSVEGFCVTAYVYGYDDSETQARLRWAIAIKLVQNALVQWASQ